MQTKFLYLTRHAQAEPYTYGKDDYSRHLIEEGLKKTHSIGDKLKKCFDNHDEIKIISSTATRAKETSKILSHILGVKEGQIEWNENIYEASIHELMQIINKVDESTHHLLIVGHNPSISNLCDYLCNAHTNLNAAETAVIALPDELNFNMLSKGLGTLQHIIH
ncbi:MAG TPA: histidine phosphatase family protein [Sphingobacterium sp.]|nr:histidine phosphatase family protein [Sphingobacterium sp.]